MFRVFLRVVNVKNVCALPVFVLIPPGHTVVCCKEAILVHRCKESSRILVAENVLCIVLLFSSALKELSCLLELRNGIALAESMRTCLVGH